MKYTVKVPVNLIGFSQSELTENAAFVINLRTKAISMGASFMYVKIFGDVVLIETDCKEFAQEFYEMYVEILDEVIESMQDAVKLSVSES